MDFWKVKKNYKKKKLPVSMFPFSELVIVVAMRNNGGVILETTVGG